MSITMYLTKHCLSNGVLEVQVAQIDDEWASSISGYKDWECFKISRDIFYSKEDAIAYADKRRDARIAALEKQIKKMRAMTFEVRQ